MSTGQKTSFGEIICRWDSSNQCLSDAFKSGILWLLTFSIFFVETNITSSGLPIGTSMLNLYGSGFSSYVMAGTVNNRASLQSCWIPANLQLNHFPFSKFFMVSFFYTYIMFHVCICLLLLACCAPLIFFSSDDLLLKPYLSRTICLLWLATFYFPAFLWLCCDWHFTLLNFHLLLAMLFIFFSL